MHWNQTSQCEIEVQFEDIDAGGVVHHPNYLKYLERARCLAMREIGVPFESYLAQGVAFAVAEVHSKYLRPLRFGQKVKVLTLVAAARNSSIKLYQKIIDASGQPEPPTVASHTMEFFAAEKSCYFQAQLRLVAINLENGLPRAIPDSLRVAGGFPSPEVLARHKQWADVRLDI